jgi:hypothetical protein
MDRTLVFSARRPNLVVAESEVGELTNKLSKAGIAYALRIVDKEAHL